MTRIGILGGSFNPAHSGHRGISLAAIRALGLDEVWWLVSPGNPLKEKSGDMAPFAIRFASARRMARHAPIRPSAIELDLHTRYTVDTVRALTRRYPENALHLADGIGQSRPVRPVARLARHSARGSDCGCRPSGL